MTSESESAGSFEVEAGDLSVSIGFPCGPALPWPTAYSLACTMHACAARGVDVQIDEVVGSSIVTTARNCVAHRFLQGKQSRLFWIDSDMEWHPDDFFRLLGLSTKMDIVCGAYPLKRDTPTFIVRHPDLTRYEINPQGCVKVEGLGLGFTVMTRRVVEAVAATKRVVLNQSSGERMADIFRLDTTVTETGDEVPRGEDIAFFEDAKALGFDAWLDPTIQLGHVGSRIYRGNVIKALHLEQVYRPKE